MTAAVENGLLEAALGVLMSMDGIYFVLTFVAVVVAVMFTDFRALREGRFSDAGRAALRNPKVRAALPAVLVLLGVTLAVGIENRFEPWLDRTPWDFTPLVHDVEGNAVERFQDAVRSPWLDTPLVIVYTFGAFLLYHVPFLWLVLKGRGRSAMRLALTLAVIWAVGLAFYVTVPVHEVWITSSDPYNYGEVENVLLEIDPSFRESAAYNNALDNNFPSLHVGVAVGIVVALFLAGERRLAWAWTPIAAGIVLATVYLGIHWFLDVAAGLVLAGGAGWLVHRKWPREDDARAPAPEAADAVEPQAS